ncbi:protein kinase family protein [Streptomyces sp. NBC_00237]|uniref:protein kinase family protein n=1 Tax=Streptomyces sp. NBC_00237 TaxID=2975687 RepID=UPI00225B421B|nr:protein kinase family protein [Streptomyces sp. NBC_00237]MCX5206449.1 protein kinase family protein [Streptomyces sp. NBC_00237]
MSLPARRTAHARVSTALALHSDRALADLLDRTAPSGSGIGGKTALLDVEGTRVFVKRVALTDLELRPENLRSTANLFDLPLFSHFGIGAIGTPGFGAWRELAAHVMTTDWALSGAYEGFPLLHHWRVLPDTTPLPDELADIDRAVAYWNDSAPMRDRIEGVRDSPASLALFLEYIPQNLHQWLGEQTAAGEESTERACALAERELAAGTAFMNDHGLLHLDAHFENILTDGHRLYFTDFGLALSDRFDLSPAEAAFCENNRTYDRAYTTWHLVSWMVANLYGYEREERVARVQAYAQGEIPTGIPDSVAKLIIRDAPLTALLSDFFRRFREESRETPYPEPDILGIGGRDRPDLFPSRPAHP